jgi:hypothetical protein
MGVNAISNANLINLCRDCGATGFLPVATYTYNAGTGAVVVTNASTIPANDTFRIAHLRLTDEFGNEVRGDITTAGTPVTLSATTLNRSKPINLTVTILTTNGIIADGSAFWLQAAGDVARWDVQKNAI